MSRWIVIISWTAVEAVAFFVAAFGDRPMEVIMGMTVMFGASLVYAPLYEEVA